MYITKTAPMVSDSTVFTTMIDSTENTMSLGIDEIPSPTSISLNNSILEWSHIFQPSDLPSEFELDHGFTISYLVNVTDRDSSGERVESLASNETSLNVSQYLDHCSRQEFTVQALVNGTLSQSRSITTDSTGEQL